jgi:hypothetical protein
MTVCFGFFFRFARLGLADSLVLSVIYKYLRLFVKQCYTKIHNKQQLVGLAFIYDIEPRIPARGLNCRLYKTPLQSPSPHHPGFNLPEGNAACGVIITEQMVFFSRLSV